MMLASVIALAAMTAAADSVHELPEVAVTAIKQAAVMDLQPVAATTITAEQVERDRVVTLKQAGEIVPNFFIPDYGSRMTSTIYVRGLGARIDQPAVGLNVDNVPVLNKNDYDFDLTDIERIEVLRGPQSVLYGRNTMGGLINIYTLSPLRWQGVRLLAEYSSGTSWRVAGGVYDKLRDDLGMSVTVNVAGTDGFYTNECNGRKADRERQASLRWKTGYRRDNFTLENIASLNMIRQGGYPYEWLATGRVAYNDTCFYRRTSAMEGLTLQWRLPSGVSVSSITGLRYMDDNMTLDQDFTPMSYFTLTQATREWSVTHDVIVRGAHRQYRWMCGGFGFFRHGLMRAPVTFLEDGIREQIIDNAKVPGKTMMWNEDSFVLGSDFTLPVWGVAAYHQSELQLDRWELTGAVRLDYERTAMHSHSYTSTSCTLSDDAGRYNVPLVIDDRSRLSRSFVELLPRVTALYRLPMPTPSTVYATVARGYKAGGYNTQMFSEVLKQRLKEELGMVLDIDVDRITSYKPEHSWNYEVGAHVACADGKVHTDLALFYIDCRDQQLTIMPEGELTGRYMANAGRTRSMGVEASVRATPCAHLALTATYGYTDARFVRFNDGRNSYDGKRIPYAPEHTVFAAATVTQPVNRPWIESVALTADCRAVGSICWNEANTEHQPLYSLLGANLTLNHRHGSLNLWCENILNTHFDTFYFVSVNRSFVQRGKPRRLGITLRITL